MSERIVVHSDRAARRSGAGHHPHRHAALLAALVGGLALAVLWSGVELVRELLGDSVSDTAPVVSAGMAGAPRADLPREWRTWKIGVDVEPMYRQPVDDRVDWIRGDGY